jgi:hypothetical protein
MYRTVCAGCPVQTEASHLVKITRNKGVGIRVMHYGRIKIDTSDVNTFKYLKFKEKFR